MNDESGPIWRIRGITASDPDAVAAVAAAKRGDMPVAEWMRLAIREKVARERGGPGEIMLPGTLPTPLDPGQVVAYIEAYRRVLELRGSRLAPRSRILIEAARMLHAPFGPASKRLPRPRAAVEAEAR